MEHKKFVWINSELAVGFGFRVFNRAFLFAWHRVEKMPRFATHKYAWYE